MKIAILGSRGIPNNYGGFEQCAEYLALGFVQRGFEVIVYNSHNHPYQEEVWKNVKLIHCYDPENKIGTAGQFIYDLNCILNLRKQNVDVVLQLGYTSSSVWGWLLPKKSVVTTNMDGLEWKRTKYSQRVRKFLLWAEKLGVKYSDHLIADSIGIQNYLSGKYKKKSVYIPYGANLFINPNVSFLLKYDLIPYNFDMLIARLEPENSIEVILDGVAEAQIDRIFLVIGKHETPYGEMLKNKYAKYKNIQFVGSVYDIEVLNNLRFFSNIYFHGHTVGGTNPSLLEAMASSSVICANDNPFNRHILNDDALYFTNYDDVAKVLKSVNAKQLKYTNMVERNKVKIVELYDWSKIVDQYTSHINEVAGVFNRNS